MLNECIDYVVNQTSADFIYILKGMDKKRYHLGNYWVGRPSIYIIEFDEQPETSPDIIRDYGTEVRKILSRISGSNFLKVGDFLEPNLRKFDDYDVYMNEALTLWIYSKKGLARWGDKKDPNHGKLVYEKHIQEEFIDYLDITYRQQLEKSSIKPGKNETIFDKRTKILNLLDISRKVGYAGEINEFHEFAGKKLKWDEMRKQAEENIRLSAEYSDDNFRKFGLVISIIFGLSAASNIAAQITLPLFSYMGVWNYYSWIPKDLQSTTSVIITMFAISILISYYWKIHLR